MKLPQPPCESIDQMRAPHRSQGSDPDRHAFAGLSNLFMGHHWDSALRFAQTLTERWPNSPLALSIQADLKLALKDPSGAAEDYRASLALASEDAMTWLMLGRCHMLCHDAQQAAKALEHGLKVLLVPQSHQPSPAWALNLRKHLIGPFGDANAPQPNHEIILRRELAEAYILADCPMKAIDALTPILDESPQGLAATLQRGIAWYLGDRLEEAKSDFDRLSRLAPHDFRPTFLSCCIRMQQGDAKGAIRLCRQNLPGHLGAASPRPMPAQPSAAPTITLPWNLSVYKFSGLFHPLLTALTANPLPDHAMAFCQPLQGEDLPDSQILGSLQGFLESYRYLQGQCPGVSNGHIFTFLMSRNLLAQILTPRDARMNIPHTAPYVFLDHPWILHVETTTTLFHPFISYGGTQGLNLERSPYYWIVKAYLNSPSCLGIFSHLKTTCTVIPKLFKQPQLADKVHYMPLASPECDAPDDSAFEDKCARALRSDARQSILFTSSFNDEGSSFFSRGGPYVLNAFHELADLFPNAELKLRCKIPEGLAADWTELILNHPRITLIDRFLPEEELIRMYVDSAILAFPSLTLHCQSLFRAMYSGAICLISDAPDYDEFVQDQKTAVRAKRGLGKTYSRDEIGMTREWVPDQQHFDRAFAQEVTTALRYVLENPMRANQIRRAARHEILTRYPRAEMFKAFRRIIGIADRCIVTMEQAAASGSGSLGLHPGIQPFPERATPPRS